MAVSIRKLYNINTEDPLPSGSFGSIFSAVNRKTKEEVIVKRALGKKQVQLANNEIQVYKKAGKHLHILKLLDHFQVKESVWLVLEKCNLRDLGTYCDKDKPNITIVTSVVCQAAIGLNYLHTLSSPIVHRDVKPGNIFLKTEKGIIHVKMGDFGLSKLANDETEVADLWMSSDCGTEGYKAPEFFDDKHKYTAAVDVFALGLTLNALVDFSQNVTDELIPAIAGARQNCPIGKTIHNKGRDLDIVHDEVEGETRMHMMCKEFVSQMTRLKPECRPSMKEIVDKMKRMEGADLFAVDDDTYTSDLDQEDDQENIDDLDTGSLKFIKKPNNLEVIEGKNAIFSCEVYPPGAQVVWLWNNASRTERWKESCINSKRRLVITNCERSDNGEITVKCGNAFCTVKLQVQVETKFIETPKDVTVNEGETAIFSCQVDPPSAQVIWLWKQETLPPLDDRWLLSTDKSIRRFELSRCEKSDAGEIIVKIGLKTCTVKLKVKDTVEPLLYVGIDIGTSFTGLAYRFRLQENITVVTDLGGQSVGFQSYKVPTCVLTDEDDRFIAFGYEAQDKYMADEDSDDEDSDDDVRSDKRSFHYYEDFKMELQGDDEIDQDLLVVPYDDHCLKAVEIYKMMLRFLKEHLLKTLAKQSENKPASDEIRWTLTVPSLWTDSAKQFMRLCAVKAGLVPSPSSNQLVIVSEAEAASCYCRTLSSEGDFGLNMSSYRYGMKRSCKLPRDAQFLVIDCGDSSVSVTAHHLKKNGDICELFSGNIDTDGGRNINVQFEKKLNEVLGQNVMDKLKSRYPSAYLHMRTKFEKEKRLIAFTDSDPKYRFGISMPMARVSEEESRASLRKIVQQGSDVHGVSFQTGILKFSKQALEDIYNLPISDIISDIEIFTRRPEFQNINYIYLVGGFSDCSLLQKMFKSAFVNNDSYSKSNWSILAPHDASLVIVRGAVMIGSSRKEIVTWRAQRFYCTASQNVSSDKQPLVPIVFQNEEICKTTEKKVSFFPEEEGNVFRLYHFQAASRNPVKYSTDRDVEVVNINISNVIPQNKTPNPNIEIHLFFRKSEIVVTAFYVHTPELPMRITVRIPGCRFL